MSSFIRELLAYATLSKKEVHTTNSVFKIVTRLTVNILFLFNAALLANSIFGDPIECVVDRKEYENLISLKCWAEGVFIDRSLLNDSLIGDITISHGVGTAVPAAQDIVHQSYYQWIIPLLIIEATIFYIPRAIWKSFENGLMEKLVDKMNTPIKTELWKDKREHLILYITDVAKKYHSCYVIKYFFCEVLSTLSIIINMILTHVIINNFWTEFRPAMSAFMIKDFKLFRQEATVLFPLAARCNYTTFGHSASIVNHDALCMMPQNVVNEKIFVFIYIWYIVILILSFSNLAMFFMMLIYNSIRILDVGRMLGRSASRRECKKISSNGHLGIWFTLKMFHKNLSPVLFQDFVKELEKKVLKSYRKEAKKSSDEEDSDYEESGEKY